MRRAVVCFSMYSDMSRRMRLSSESKSCWANALAVSVLPTPVGPKEDERADGTVWVGEARAGSDGWRR